MPERFAEPPPPEGVEPEGTAELPETEGAVEVPPQAPDVAAEQEQEPASPEEESVEELATEEQEPTAPAFELKPEEQEALEQVLAETRKGLASLYDITPHRGSINQNEFNRLIDLTELKVLWPGARRMLGDRVRSEKLNEKSRADFIERGLAALALVTHEEALNRVADWHLERLRRQIRENL